MVTALVRRSVTWNDRLDPNVVVDWEIRKLSPCVVVRIWLCAPGSIRPGPVKACDIADMDMLVLPVIVRTSVPVTVILSTNSGQ